MLLPGHGIPALAALTPTGTIPAGTVVVATGAGGGRTAALHLVQLGSQCTQTTTTAPNSSEDSEARLGSRNLGAELLPCSDTKDLQKVACIN